MDEGRFATQALHREAQARAAERATAERIAATDAAEHHRAAQAALEAEIRIHDRILHDQREREAQARIQRAQQNHKW